MISTLNTNTTFSAIDLHISVGPERLFSIAHFAVTNTMVTGLLGIIVTLIILFYVSGKVRRGSYNRFVGLVQWVFEGLLKQIADVVPDKKLARKISPLAITIFFIVLISYWLSVLPGLDSITIGNVPVLRSLTTDLNFTLGLAIITVVTVQMYAIKHLGVFGNLGRYFRNPIKDPLGAFEGILELIGEVSRGAALALRLFGNAFAGEVLLLVIAALTNYFAVIALPVFMGFELFIGFIQAYVFFVLTLIFTSLAVSSHGEPAIEAEIDSATPTKTAKQLE